MLKGCLVFSYMRLGVSFIAPRQLGAVESILGRLILPSVDRRTGQSGAHRTLSGARFVSLNSASDRCCQSQICAPLAHRTCPVHTGQSGVPFRPLARPRVARRSRGRPLARPTVGSPDSPVNYSRTPLITSRDQQVRLSQPGASPNGLSGAPCDSSLHQTASLVVGVINTPTNPTFKSSKFSNFQPLTRARHSIQDTPK